MIILEGTDCSGKSTLAWALHDAFHAPIISLGRPTVERRHWDQVREALETKPLNTIYDRMVVGATIYPHLIKDAINEKFVTEDEFHRWAELMEHLSAIVVYCDVGGAALKKRYKERGDEYVDLPITLAAAAGYEGRFRAWMERGSKVVVPYLSDLSTPAQFIAFHKVPLASATNLTRLPNDTEMALIRTLMR